MLDEERNLRKTKAQKPKAAWLHSTGYGLDNHPSLTVQLHASACSGMLVPIARGWMLVIFKCALLSSQL